MIYLVLWTILGPFMYLAMEQITPVLKQLDGTKGKTNTERALLIGVYFVINILIGPLGWLVNIFGILLAVYWTVLFCTVRVANYILFVLASMYFCGIIVKWGWFPVLKIKNFLENEQA